MAEFYEGTLDTLMERLCSSISTFDQEWVKHCEPATEEQIRQLQDIFAEYHYTIPAAYLHFLRRMGQNDGGLLEREWDGCEVDIATVLECLDDRREALKEGFFQFSYHWADANFYLDLSSMDDNPVVTDICRNYMAGSFEKYLFRKAFYMYQQHFAHSDFHSPSVCREENKDKEDCKMCPFCGDTAEERMDFIIRMADMYGLKKAWFSDRTHFICFNSNYAFEIRVDEGYAVEFCCNNDALWKKVRYCLNLFLNLFPKFFSYVSEFGDCGDRNDG